MTLGRMSLTKRMSLLSTIVLLAFLGLMALVLDAIFSISLENVVQEKLKLHTFQLLSAGNSMDDTISMPVQLSEPRFNQSQGSLIAFVTELTLDNQQSEVWRSISATDKQFSFPAPDSGMWLFGRARDSAGAQFYVSSYNTTWSNDAGLKSKYIFTVMEDLSYYDAELSKYRSTVAFGLLAFGLVFLALQTLILRVGLSPLRRLTADIAEMNRGETSLLSGPYSSELDPLTKNLNQLVKNERLQRERYRERMADLSHGLKTPLSVLNGLESDIDEQGRLMSRENLLEILKEQVRRMTNLVNYQLQRAIPSGVPTVLSRIDLVSKAEEIISALDKVYAHKAITCEVQMEERLAFYGDENDLIEMIGNLLDNAYKHSENVVHFSASKRFAKSGNPRLTIAVEDDGVGVPKEKRATILQRGVKLDSSSEGQGFGLSIVLDIVDSYQGVLTVKESLLGGALFQITLPTR